MSNKREKNEQAQGEEGSVTSLWSGMRSFQIRPWLERAEKMVQARPALTLGIAAGAGFLLGVSVLSRFGRVLLVSTLGIATDLLLASRRAGGTDLQEAKATS